MSSLLRRAAVFSARHRALVIGVWLVLLGGLVEDILDAAAAPAEGSGVQVEAGGQLGTKKISRPETHSSEIIGLAAAMLILVVVFGTVTAMALPTSATSSPYRTSRRPWRG